MKPVYFLSDFHLGVPDEASSKEREQHICHFLDTFGPGAEEIFLVGDIFDMWFEYRTVVPKGYIRLLSTLLRLRDAGVKITAFTGNHDMWMFGYFEKELGIPVHRTAIEREWNGRKFLIGHGDGLGPGDHGYKLIKKVFANKVCQWLFGWIHPDIGLPLANFWSRRSRIATGSTENKYLGDDKEYLTRYCHEVLKTKHFDYFIFGHRHLPLTVPVGNSSQYINLGDWVQYFTFAVFDGEHCELKSFPRS